MAFVFATTASPERSNDREAIINLPIPMVAEDTLRQSNIKDDPEVVDYYRSIFNQVMI